MSAGVDRFRSGPPRPQSRVAILHEDSYSGPLDRTLIEGIRLFDLNLRGKTVLLKPNLVAYIQGAEVNTNPWLVGAAASAFLALGAKTVARRRRTRPPAGIQCSFSPRAAWSGASGK